MKNWRIRSVIVSSLIVLLVLLSGCGADKNAKAPANGNSAKETPAKQNIKIGVVLPMTGGASLFGKQELAGMETAVEVINKAGGVLGGRQLELIVEDDQMNPEVGVSAVKKLMQQGASVVMGNIGSSVALAELQVTKEAKFLQVVSNPQAGNLRQQGHPYAIFISNTTDMDGAVSTKYIAENMKPKTVALITENSDYGKAVANTLKNNFTGGDKPQLITTEFYNAKDTDFTVALTKMKGLKPDLTWIISSGTQNYGAILNQMKEMDYKGQKVIGNGGVCDDLIKVGGPATEGVLGFASYWYTLDNPENKAFIDAYKAKFKGQMPGQQEDIGFESVNVLTKAMDKAGSDNDYAKIMDSLKANKWNTTRGEVSFDSVGQAQQKATILLTIKDGKVEVVK